MNNIDKFKNTIFSVNYNQISEIWNTLSPEEKEEVRKEINLLNKEVRKNLQEILTVTENEDICKFLLGKSVELPNLNLDGKEYKPKEIIDLCITEIKYLPKAIMKIYSLEEKEQKRFMKTIEIINKNFYNSISASIDRLNKYSESSGKEKEQRKDSGVLSPITFLCSYVENKSEVLNCYRKKLEEKGLTSEQISVLLQIEAEMLNPERFHDQGRTTF